MGAVYCCPARPIVNFDDQNGSVRPDALFHCCCTLPDACSLVGILCLKKVCCYDSQSNVAAMGCFARYCGPCCSLAPLINYLSRSLDRPPRYFLAPTDDVDPNDARFKKHDEDGTDIRYRHVSFNDYAGAVGTVKYEGSTKNKCPVHNKTRRRAVDSEGQGPEACPWVGEGGRNYAVSVPGKSLVERVANLPDPGDMFDKLIKRETFKPCPRGANALLVYVALLATHEFFRSDTGRGEDGDGMHREWVNAHSSFLDLQSLYGSSPEEAKGARSFKDGKLKLDCVGERRLLRLPVMRAILKLFALEHNYIAEQLTEHHGGEFSDEEGLFQAARAVMLAQFIQIITYDYVGGINGPEALHSMERFLQNSRPFKKEGDIAMHVSVEFKLMYQFHATIPEKFSEDGDWLGLDDNDDVEAVLGAALKIPSGAFGSRNTPAFLRRAEIASVNFGRRTGMCSYNDMRKHLGLEPAESFESICSDPDVVCRLREFYPGGIEDLELYIGCTVEENRSWPQGWSLGPTLFTALVQDALASGMGDFFHTVGFKPEYLTKWGYKHALREGRMVHLINRHTSLQLDPDFDIFRVPGCGVSAQKSAGAATVAPQPGV